MSSRALKAGVVFALAFATALAAAPAGADPQFVMKITLPTIHEANWQAATEYAARVEKGSSGRIKTEVYPASQLGSIPRQIEGVQFGSIQCAFIPPEFFVGVDDRFQIMAAPGLVDSMDNAQKVSQDPEVQKLLLSLGATKGLHGVGLFAATPSFLVAKSPIRRLADFKRRKIRVLASDFQMKAFERLGANPVAMSLGDVLPAIQQGTIDASVSGLTVFTSMSFQDAAKYVTEIQQPYIFIIIEISARWRASLPPDLQKIVDEEAAEEAKAIYGYALEDLEKGRKTWVANGGELIDLSADEQSAMMETFGSVDQDVSSNNPELAAAYKIVSDAAKRDR
jgi:TRAP-type C4-dicarboxylate transport system substrate-binding protein